jgi:hypothetical protein
MLRCLSIALLLCTALPAAALAAQIDSAAVPSGRPISAEPVDRATGWPDGRYFRVVFSGIASDKIIVNGYRADVVMLENGSGDAAHFAIARIPDDAAVTRGFITFMVTAKTAYGYAPAVPLKINM